MNDRIDIAKRRFLAYANSDRKAIEALIAADFRFTSPLDNGIDRSAYMAACWPNHERITAFTFIRLAQFDEDVLVTYEGRTIDGRTFRNTEVLTIRDDRIVAVEVYFGWNVPHEVPAGGSVESDTP